MNKSLLQRIATVISTAPQGETYEDCRNNEAKSYLRRIPSQDFWDEAYQLFLEFATPEELEKDILKRETLQKINTTLGYN